MLQQQNRREYQINQALRDRGVAHSMYPASKNHMGFKNSSPLRLSVQIRSNGGSQEQNVRFQTNQFPSMNLRMKQSQSISAAKSNHQTLMTESSGRGFRTKEYIREMSGGQMSARNTISTNRHNQLNRDNIVNQPTITSNLSGNSRQNVVTFQQNNSSQEMHQSDKRLQLFPVQQTMQSQLSQFNSRCHDNGYARQRSSPLRQSKASSSINPNQLNIEAAMATINSNDYQNEFIGEPKILDNQNGYANNRFLARINESEENSPSHQSKVQIKELIEQRNKSSPRLINIPIH